MSGGLADAVRLTPVLGDLVVDHADNVGADGGPEDGRQADGAAGHLILRAVDGNQRSGRS